MKKALIILTTVLMIGTGTAMASMGAPTGGAPTGGANQAGDDSMSWSNLVNPESYTEDQLKAAQNYVLFTTKAYETPFFGVDWGTLTELAQQMGKTEFTEWFEENFSKSEEYRQLQAQIRTYIAQESLVTGNFDWMIGLREKFMGDGKSSFDLMNYVVKNWIDNPEFYPHMETATDTDVKRMQLVAELTMVMQAQQRMQTDERILAVDDQELQLKLRTQKAKVAEAAQAVNVLINEKASTVRQESDNSSGGVSAMMDKAKAKVGTMAAQAIM